MITADMQNMGAFSLARRQADASLKAIPVAPEDIPARWWKPQPPKSWNTPRSEPTSNHSNQLRPPSETLPQWLALARSV
jgi:hypothetical protein